MDALRQPNLDLSNSSPLSSIYTKTPQTPTSSTFPYKYRLSSSSFNGYHSKCKVPTPPQALPKENSNESVESNKKLIDSIAKGLIRLAAAVSVNAVQRTLVETWGLIRETFVDPTFNHQDWDSKFQQTMVEMHPLRTVDAAYSKIKGMLFTLEDRFTRIISPKENQSFRIGSDGNVQGVGLFLNTESETGHLVLLSYVEGSPAAKAGIHVGDELIEINGERVKGISGEAAAQKLKGYVGTSVTVKVHNGGLVKAGLDVAQICLDGDETLVNTIDRDGNMLPVNMINGHAVTHDPLVVLFFDMKIYIFTFCYIFC
ncbi:unnamed protein product [Lactuca saligna]|uniref:C-terminal processing peptidase n=1 Tax=Lactuca saligna TaxID=75948 RepID=A0AA35YV49_LACSI|nr:unnamed protein product [Lactuca saligna]